MIGSPLGARADLCSRSGLRGELVALCRVTLIAAIRLRLERGNQKTSAISRWRDQSRSATNESR